MALVGIPLIPGISGAAEPTAATSSLHVTVTPASGSRLTHFKISFKTIHATGVVGVERDFYRITVGDPATADARRARPRWRRRRRRAPSST